MLNALKRKCTTCGNKFRRDEMYRINMKLVDGDKTLLICETCASKLLVSEDVMIQNMGTKDE